MACSATRCTIRRCWRLPSTRFVSIRVLIWSRLRLPGDGRSTGRREREAGDCQRKSVGRIGEKSALDFLFLECVEVDPTFERQRVGGELIAPNGKAPAHAAAGLATHNPERYAHFK